MATEPVDTPEEGEDVALTPALTVRVREATPEQFALIIKFISSARRDPGARGMAAIDGVFRIFEKMLVHPERDGPLIDDALIEGTLTMDKLAIGMGVGEEPDSAAAAPPTKRVRRAAKR